MKKGKDQNMSEKPDRRKRAFEPAPGTPGPSAGPAYHPSSYDFRRHPKDVGVDEILLCTEIAQSNDQAEASAFLRIGLIERYKTSGLSGDEWRFSTGLWVRELPRRDWRLISTGGSLEGHCAQLYPELYGDFESGRWPREFFTRKVGSVVFRWKGEHVWACSMDGRQADLLVTAGHLPWSWTLCADQGSDPKPLERLCCQPGCAEPLVSIYRVKQYFPFKCSCGRPGDWTLEGDIPVRENKQENAK